MPLDLLNPGQLMTALIPDLVLAVGTLVVLLFAGWRPASEAHQRAVGFASLAVLGATLVAVALVAAAWGFARLPRLGPAERAELASRFAFDRAPLAVPAAAGEPRTIRAVHPSLQRIAGWISSVGAAVALADLDGDGLPNDACLVDPRTDVVAVAPVPGSGRRYAPFPLVAPPPPWDAATTAPMGCLPGDLDEDGRQDLLVYYWGRTPVAFLSRGGAAAGPPRAAGYVAREIARPERWYTNALTRADLDGDGHLDLVVGNYFQDGAAILDPHGTGSERMQRSMSRAADGGRNRLLLFAGARPGAEPGVTYREVDALPEAVARGWTLAIGAADLDGDLLPELYFGNDFGPDRLLHNRSRPGSVRFALVEGRRGPTTVRSKVLGQDSFKGMGIDFADLDGDGRLDFWVSNIAAPWSLEESHLLFVSTGEVGDFAAGRAPYVEESEPLGLARSGWGWDARFADFDNDGALEAVQATGFLRGTVNRWPELHELAMGNDELLRRPGSWTRLGPGADLSGRQPNAFFVRAGSGRWFDLAADVGLREPWVSRGLATGDVDGDGRLDLAVANQWQESWLLRNRAPEAGDFLGLHLLLPVAPGTPFAARAGHPGADTPGFPAVGAEARVAAADGRRWVAQVDGGNGHSGKEAPALHFGL
ncbi:MAG TPA: VCBS repeat-containing protein, partial [Thermoanaerobaculia bacterium]|nr:VCBS repeat-containing protein [Thermoanaerobaculia bacterium]